MVTLHPVRNQKARHVGVHPFLCSLFLKSGTPPNGLVPTIVIRNVSPQPNVSGNTIRDMSRDMFPNYSNHSQVDSEDEPSELSMNQDKVSDDNFY